MPTHIPEHRNDLLTRGGGVQQFFYYKNAMRLPTISHADGIYIWDIHDKRYIDASSGPVAVNIGHGNKRVISAIAEQAKHTTFAFPLMFENQPNINFGNELVKHLPVGLDRVFATSGGSEAIEACLKFARIYAIRSGQDNRHKFISRNPSYHGATLGAQGMTGDETMNEMFAPITKASYKIPAPLSYRIPNGLSIESYANQCAAALETEIIKQGPETVLGFIIEPIAGLSGGADYAPATYYKKIRDICTKYGVLLIFDEILSGLGRSGTFIASDYWPDARPDLLALSKGLGAGYMPVGAMVVPAYMAELVAESGGFPHAQTYTSTPLAGAASMAVLAEILDNNLVENSQNMGKILLEKLEVMKDKFPIIGDVRGKGLLLSVEFVADKESKRMLPLELNAPARVNQIAMENNLMFYPRRANGGKYGDWLMVTPPLIIEESQVMELCEKFETTLQIATDEFLRAGYIK